MSRRFVGYKQHKRGIPNSDGGTKTCMHCGKKATWSARKVRGGLTMDVWFCSEHKEYAQSLG